MYFATLTEVPIVQGLVGNGMGDGPALALLLAGPALSLPSMLVIRQVLGAKKTITYVALVVAMATLSGWLFGQWAKVNVKRLHRHLRDRGSPSVGREGATAGTPRAGGLGTTRP